MSICANCIHKNVCDHESKYRKKCGQFLAERPHVDCRDKLKEVFREYSEIGGVFFHLSEIERIIDGEDWL